MNFGHKLFQETHFKNTERNAVSFRKRRNSKMQTDILTTNSTFTTRWYRIRIIYPFLVESYKILSLIIFYYNFHASRISGITLELWNVSQSVGAWDQCICYDIIYEVWGEYCAYSTGKCNVRSVRASSITDNMRGG